jgi:cytochrome c-type biogenesis protein CcmH
MRRAGAGAVRPRGRRRSVAALLAAALALTAPAAAAAQCPRTSLADIEDEVMCPVCGTPLNLATDAPQAQRQREFVVRLIEQCKSKDEIKSALRAEFGDDVLSLPEDEGFDLAAYLVPLLAAVAAIGGGAALLISWRRRRPAREPAGDGRADEPEPLDREDASRLQADMDRYEA